MSTSVISVRIKKQLLLIYFLTTYTNLFWEDMQNFITERWVLKFRCFVPLTGLEGISYMI